MLDGQRLLIVDNCSDVPVKETLEPWLQSLGATNVSIVRNATNLGSGANILRCLELCETRWLYCLGDDDLVAPDCINNIERTITAHRDALYLSFSRSILRRRGVVRAEGLVEFLENLDDWSTFLFMSATVVNAERLRTQARWGYLYAYSWAPLQAILVKMLNEGGGVVFADSVLCEEESMAEESWVPFPVAAGKMVLPELVDDEDSRRKFARRLASQPNLLSLIYWARVNGNLVNLPRNRFFIDLYIARCARYVGFWPMFLYKAIAFVVLRPRIMPTWLFNYVQTLVFRGLRRTVPKGKPMSDSRA
jgi:hypothetical protein